MPRFIPSADYSYIMFKGGRHRVLPPKAFEGFDISVLGLGNVGAPSEPTDALAAVFDLAGFTNFCKQIEPHLSVPHYLHAFLDWLLGKLRDEMVKSRQGDQVVLWSDLPFFVKYLGDGLLVLWDCKGLDHVAQRNVIVSMSIICDAYKDVFLPKLRAKIVEPPSKLRCGLARGTVFSVGEGQDYVGSCINMASRLQKLPGISFCFNRRGFDLERDKPVKFFRDEVAVREVSIRGIGDHELICVLRSEIETLLPKDIGFYKEV